jgi:DNA-binding GntR family transcriptional regulator
MPYTKTQRLRAQPARVRRSARSEVLVTTEGIVEHLTAAVTQHRLAPGTQLVEESLGEFFGVSRTKVRQALHQLATNKLVTLQAGRGAFVAQPTVREARELFDARRVVERAVVGRFVEVAGEGDFAKLRQHMKLEHDAVRKQDVQTRNQLLGDFHLLIAEGAGNGALAEILQELVSRTSLVTLLYQSGRDALCSSDEHVVLLQALERRDANTAMKLVDEHLTHVEAGLALKEEVPETINLRDALASVRR